MKQLVKILLSGDSSNVNDAASITNASTFDSTVTNSAKNLTIKSWIGFKKLFKPPYALTHAFMRSARATELAAQGGFETRENQSPWQQYFREMVQPFSEGMVLRDTPNYQSIATTKGIPRDNH